MGIGSSKQVVDFMLDTCLMRASESSSEKWVRETPANQDGRKSEGSGNQMWQICLWTLSILEFKKKLKKGITYPLRNRQGGNRINLNQSIYSLEQVSVISLIVYNCLRKIRWS